jgi:capsular polysaccharide export protein
MAVARLRDPPLAPDAPRRTVLFLQGPPSGFWAELGDAVAARGARVLRVNLCLADRLFWRRPGAVDYRGSLRGWRHWLAAHMARESVTDVLCYADRLPYHRIAAAVARRRGAGVHAVEFGYLRPDWLTLETGGNGAQSRFPADSAALRHDLPSPQMTERYTHRFAQEATGEVLFNLSMTAGRPLYPCYVTDKPVPPVLDYLLWLGKLARQPAALRHAAAVEARLLGGDAPFFLVGLQLPVDYQLRHSAWFADQRAMVRAVVASFARHAPPQTRLLFKAHPLDNGATPWGRIAAQAASGTPGDGRVDCIDGGNLGALLHAARGVVVANSTVGLHALRAGTPVKALGAAVYAMEGLTDPQPLSGFWTAPVAPDPALLRHFMGTLAADIQIKGSFYHTEGRRVAAAAIAERVATGRVGPPGPSARPPRLQALRAMRQALADGRAEP